MKGSEEIGYQDLPAELKAVQGAMDMILGDRRKEMITRWEERGLLDPNCPGCKEFYDSPKLPIDVFAPSHKASGGCQSGQRPHCTCDTCF